MPPKPCVTVRVQASYCKQVHRLRHAVPFPPSNSHPSTLPYLQHQLFKRSSQHLRQRVRRHVVLVKRFRVEPPALAGTHTPCSPCPLAAAGLKMVHPSTGDKRGQGSPAYSEAWGVLCFSRLASVPG